MTNSTKIKTLPLSSKACKPDKNGFCPITVSEIIREGTGVSPGIVIGKVFVFDNKLKSIPQYRITPDDVKTEQKRFLTAVEKTIAQFNAILAKAKSVEDDDPLTSLLDVYMNMLRKSRLSRGVMSRIRDNLVNAESAVKAEVASIAEVFKAMEDDYISARIADIRGLSDRIILNLQTEAKEKTARLPENAVIISSDLTAADTALLNLNKIAAFVTTGGAPQSHAALLARSLGMPAIVGIPDLLQIARTGDNIIIDGTYGKVILCPSQKNIDLYRKYRSDFLRWKRSLKRLRDQVSVTTDNVKITLKGNIDLPSEVAFLQQTGADGIGLMRSEYLYLNRSNLPSEDEQFEVLRKIGQQMDGKPITFRTFDCGGDKCAEVLKAEQTANPALGLRGIRYMTKSENLLHTQFRAILRASVLMNIRILLPMISSIDELIKAKEIYKNAADSLRTQGVTLPENLPQIGIMIEVPSAAIEAATLARHCDFFSIGTNDLIQYALAVDRSDSSVASLFNPLHPAVMKLLKMAVDGANAANIPISVCGEMAANHRYTALLIGLGIRELSMPAINIPMVKERLRSLSLHEMANYANHLLSLSFPTDISKAFNDFEIGVRF